MNLDEYIKQFVKTDLSLEQIWVKAQEIATTYGIDLTTLDEANAQFIAGEIDAAVSSGLAVPENNGSGLATVEPNKKGKKNTSATNDSQQAQTLKPAVIGLRNAIESEVTGLSNAFDTEFTKNEKKAAKKITERAKQFAPNVVNYVAEELEGYKADSQIFHGQITGVIEEAFGGFFDN
jgi:hypothetical protein